MNLAAKKTLNSQEFHKDNGLRVTSLNSIVWIFLHQSSVYCTIMTRLLLFRRVFFLGLDPPGQGGILYVDTTFWRKPGFRDFDTKMVSLKLKNCLKPCWKPYTTDIEITFLFVINRVSRKDGTFISPSIYALTLFRLRIPGHLQMVKHPRQAHPVIFPPTKPLKSGKALSPSP